MHRDHQRRFQRDQHLDHAFEIERVGAVDRHQHDIDAADLVQLLLRQRVMQVAEMRDAQVRHLVDEDRVAVALRAAEEEFARDAEFTLRRLFHIGFGETPRDEKMSLYVDRQNGFLGPAHDVPLPPWLSGQDIATFAAEYARTGFRGGLNWYRNIDRNWELTAPWQNAVIAQPALFIAGGNDAVITGSMGQRALDELETVVPNLKRKILIDGAGHWIQQERPDDVNDALIAFAREYFKN